MPRAGSPRLSDRPPRPRLGASPAPQVARDLGVVGRRAERRRGLVPQGGAALGEARLDPDRGGKALGGADVLRHEAQRESGGVALGEDELLDLGLGRVVAAGRGVEHVGHHRGVEAEGFPDAQRLDRGDEAGARDVVVERLHGVAGAERAGAEDDPSHRRKHWLDGIDRRGVTAGHDRERAVDRALDAARDRRVDETDGGSRDSAPRARVPTGSDELMSMTIAPGARCGRIAATTAATALPSGSMVMTTGMPATAASTSATLVAPAIAAKRSRAADAASQPVTLYPASMRRAAIGTPMLPRPMKATAAGGRIGGVMRPPHPSP